MTCSVIGHRPPTRARPTRGRNPCVTSCSSWGSPRPPAPSGSSKWTAGTGDDIYRASGNVGIGTTNPGKKLELADTTGVQLRLRQTDVTTMDIGASQAISSDMILTVSPNDSNSGVWFKNRDSGGTLGNGIVLRGTGNVGIGTSNPTHTLDVDGTVRIGGATFTFMNGTNPACPAGTGPLARKYTTPSCSGCSTCTLATGWSITPFSCTMAPYTDPDFGSCYGTGLCYSTTWSEQICIGNN